MYERFALNSHVYQSSLDPMQIFKHFLIFVNFEVHIVFKNITGLKKSYSIYRELTSTKKRPNIIH